MSADNVTPIRPGAPMDSLDDDDSPIGDPVNDLVGRLALLAGDCPIDGLWPGYTIGRESRQERARVVELLREVEYLLKRCISREKPRCEPFYEAFSLKEQRKWAAKGGEADPLN